MKMKALNLIYLLISLEKEFLMGLIILIIKVEKINKYYSKLIIIYLMV